jgi:hypothetical protein
MPRRYTQVLNLAKHLYGTGRTLNGSIRISPCSFIRVSNTDDGYVKSNAMELPFLQSSQPLPRSRLATPFEACRSILSQAHLDDLS